MTQSIAPRTVAAVGFTAFLIAVFFSLYGRWTLFIPSQFFESSRNVFWAISSLAIFFAMIARVVSQKKMGRDPPNVSHIVLLFLATSLIFGFFLREAAFGVLALANTASKDLSSFCIQVKSIQRNTSGLVARTQYARVVILGQGTLDDRELRYLDGRLVLQAWKKDEIYSVEASEGWFGYSVVKGQNLLPSSDCPLTKEEK
jgi:hypothetical protein